MKFLIFLLIINSIGISVIYLSYRFFSWLLIESDPFLSPVKKDQPLHKPNFFGHENKKLTKKDLKDQDNFALTEVPNDTQIFDKTTQNDSISNNILIYGSKKTKSAHWGA